MDLLHWSDIIFGHVFSSASCCVVTSMLKKMLYTVIHTGEVIEDGRFGNRKIYGRLGWDWVRWSEADEYLWVPSPASPPLATLRKLYTVAYAVFAIGTCSRIKVQLQMWAERNILQIWNFIVSTWTKRSKLMEWSLRTKWTTWVMHVNEMNESINTCSN